MALFSVWGWGQVLITGTLPQSYSQDFNTLSTSSTTWNNNSTLQGWYISSTTLAQYTATSNSNNCYNTGASGNNDRSIGALSTGTSHYFGVRIKNNSGQAISSLTISFTGEQWRQNSSGTLLFSYRVSASAITDLTSGTYIDASAFNFTSLSNSSSTNTASGIDGNDSANRTNISSTLSVNIPAGSEIMLKWLKSGSNSPILSVDDLNITANAACTTSTFSFATSPTVNKLTTDAPFTNTFTTNNTSATAYTSSNTNAATVNTSTGQVTIVGAGTTTIGVTQAADGTRCAVSSSYTLNVTAPVIAPTVTASTFSGTVGNSFSQTVSAANNPTSYEVTSGSVLPAGLSLNTTTGAIAGTPTTAVTGFTTNITASNSAGSGSANITFNIAKANQTVTLNDLTANLGAANVTLPATTTQGLAIAYTSSNSAVASITGNTLSYTGVGTATITASNVGDSNYNSFNQTFIATVNFDTTIAPVATAATNTSSNNFTANWNVLNGANSYRLDVYTTSGSVTPGVTVVGWDFENSSATANTGISSNINSSITSNAGTVTYSGAVTTPASTGNVATTGNGNWTNGSNTKYWKTNFGTIGLSNLKLSSVQRSSNSGPRDFKIQYSLDDSTWTDVTNSTVIVGNDWTTGSLNNLILPTACDNKSTVYLRWIMTSNTSVNNGSIGSQGTSAIDNILIIGDQSTVVNNYVLQNQNVGNVSSYVVSNLTPATTYNYVVRGVNGSNNTVSSNVISIATTLATTLTTTWSGSWDNGTPDATKNVVLTSSYTTSTTTPAFTAKNITIQNGGVLEITAGNTVNAVDVTVEDGGNLIQKDGSTLSYTGTFKVLKNGNSDVGKYAFWSSPVDGQSLNAIYGSLAPDYITEYDTPTDYFVNAGSTTSVFGKGYSIKTPNVSSNHVVTFTGVPNNGTQTVALSNGGNRYNLVGNPYPSDLNLDALYALNASKITSTFYFWDNASASVTTQSGGTTNNYGYATYNASATSGTSGTFVASPNVGSINPSGNVAKIGQGFFVRLSPNLSNNTSLNFDNSLRVASTGTFFNKNNNAGVGKYWLRLSSSYGTNNTLAVTYSPAASNSYDAFDSKAIAMGSDGFYTVADAQKLIIQGRETFNINDVVPVGTKHFENGNFTIALIQKEGLFNNGQAVYLHDKVMGTYTDLQNGSYSFAANVGENSNRFEIVYKLGVLSTSEVTKDAFEVYRNGEDFFVRNDKNIDSVTIYDASGRQIQTLNGGAKEIRISLNAKGVYLVKAVSQGKEYTKKIIK